MPIGTAETRQGLFACRVPPFRGAAREYLLRPARLRHACIERLSHPRAKTTRAARLAELARRTRPALRHSARLTPNASDNSDRGRGRIGNFAALRRRPLITCRVLSA